MADVFISYHEKSSGDLVKQIADTLESAGISCWYAKRDLPPGGKFADYIPKEIRSCKVFLLVLNEGSNHSEHVKSETNLAFRRVNKQEQITLVPFKVDNCVLDDDVDYYLSRFNIANGNPADAQSIRNLAERISRILTPATVRTREQKLSTESETLPSGFKFAFWACAACIVVLAAFIIAHIITSSSEPIIAQDNTYAWTLYANGLLQIDAEGAMDDYGPAEYSDSDFDKIVPWVDYRMQISSVKMFDRVTEIGNYAFANCPGLASVTIPNSVTRIGDGAFSDCTGLRFIQIPDGVTEIGGGAFKNCTALRDKVVIPDSVIHIKEKAFADCPSLKAISVSEKTEIAPDAFPNPDIIEIRPSSGVASETEASSGASQREPEELWDAEPEELW